MLRQRVLVYYCCCCGRCSTTRRWWSTGNDPTESSVEQDCVSSGYWKCVLWTGSSCPTESRREVLTENEPLTLNNLVNVCTCTIWYGRTHEPAPGPDRQIHGPAQVIVGPSHIEPVFHGSRCHVMGRAGPGREFLKLSWAGPGRGPSSEKLVGRAGPAGPAQPDPGPAYHRRPMTSPEHSYVRVLYIVNDLNQKNGEVRPCLLQ